MHDAFQTYHCFYNMKEKGLTLIELLVVMAIMGILIVALGFSFEGWRGKYRVESQIKDIYVDLMNARARAMQRNRVNFVSLSATQYTIYEDTNPVPDGNGVLEVGSDTQVLQKGLISEEPFSWNGTNNVEINTRGLLSNIGTGQAICIISDYDPDYDCITLRPTRINLGKIINQESPCATSNCDAK